MTYRLALDCSTSRGSVTLAEAAGPMLWQAEIPAGRGHGGQLFTVLERALGEIRAANGTLSHIVVGLGPGSYSGVRQAVAAAVGLAAATGAALVGAPSPAALPVTGLPEVYRAVSDARRGDVLPYRRARWRLHPRPRTPPRCRRAVRPPCGTSGVAGFRGGIPLCPTVCCPRLPFFFLTLASCSIYRKRPIACLPWNPSTCARSASRCPTQRNPSPRELFRRCTPHPLLGRDRPVRFAAQCPRRARIRRDGRLRSSPW